MPTDRVDGLLNPLTLRMFNALYHAKGKWKAGRRVIHYEPFLYPLDSIHNWNRLYGRRGFYQYQCAIPNAAGREPIRDMLREISASGEGSFLAVLKRFGNAASPGMLSFPLPGLTLALDFRNRGARTHAILTRLDEIVQAANGRHYAAKDMRLPAAAFKRAYPALGEFERLVDPSCQSEFWTRLNS
jgi:L-gulonolactone oxidase